MAKKTDRITIDGVDYLFDVPDLREELGQDKNTLDKLIDGVAEDDYAG